MSDFEFDHQSAYVENEYHDRKSIRRRQDNLSATLRMCMLSIITITSWILCFNNTFGFIFCLLSLRPESTAFFTLPNQWVILTSQVSEIVILGGFLSQVSSRILSHISWDIVLSCLHSSKRRIRKLPHDEIVTVILWPTHVVVGTLNYYNFHFFLL